VDGVSPSSADYESGERRKFPLSQRGRKWNIVGLSLKEPTWRQADSRFSILTISDT